jgi:glucose-6-phosphate isomerase
MVSQHIGANPLDESIRKALDALVEANAARRIWDHDASFWKTEPEPQKIINNALGWLDVARSMSERVDELATFADQVSSSGFKHAMILGMGGSSLCPEVFRRTFGHREGFPELMVLDTTDPDTISDFESRIDLRWTLFIVASKSGTTIEPLSFYRYFYDRVRSIKGESAGDNFVAITDPGTLMDQMATEANFRHIFRNPADIGGRYSALSYFGMVPAAVMGIDVCELLRGAVAMMDQCGPDVPVEQNPAMRLGAVMGACAAAGRDKLTIAAEGDIASVGLWIEQLVAESTGKEGKGIIPVASEALGAPDEYGSDRIFVSIHTGDTSSGTRDRMESLANAGHPTLEHKLDGPIDLGAEFFLWEFATAVAGHLLGINAFDQPNVQESKDATNALLAEFKETGALPAPVPLVIDGERQIFGAMPEAGDGASETVTAESIMLAHLARIKPGDYFALLAYIHETEAHDQLLHGIASAVRRRYKIATTIGYGPRFLHSTGQLHKGGPDSGVFLQITDMDAVDLPIPGEPYTFGILKQAQASGDFTSLEKRHRRALRLDLGTDATGGLQWLLELVKGS